MNISVRVVTRSKKTEIIPATNPDEEWKIRINTPPVDGAANKKVRELLAKYFKVSKSSVQIIRGETSHHKVISIAGVHSA